MFGKRDGAIETETLDASEESSASEISASEKEAPIETKENIVEEPLKQDLDNGSVRL